MNYKPFIIVLILLFSSLIVYAEDFDVNRAYTALNGMSTSSIADLAYKIIALNSGYGKNIYGRTNVIGYNTTLAGLVFNNYGDLDRISVKEITVEEAYLSALAFNSIGEGDKTRNLTKWINDKTANYGSNFFGVNSNGIYRLYISSSNTNAASCRFYCDGEVNPKYYSIKNSKVSGVGTTPQTFVDTTAASSLTTGCNDKIYLASCSDASINSFSLVYEKGTNFYFLDILDSGGGNLYIKPPYVNSYEDTLYSAIELKNVKLSDPIRANLKYYLSFNRELLSLPSNFEFEVINSLLSLGIRDITNKNYLSIIDQAPSNEPSIGGSFTGVGTSVYKNSLITYALKDAGDSRYNDAVIWIKNKLVENQYNLQTKELAMALIAINGIPQKSYIVPSCTSPSQCRPKTCVDEICVNPCSSDTNDIVSSCQNLNATEKYCLNNRCSECRVNSTASKIKDIGCIDNNPFCLSYNCVQCSVDSDCKTTGKNKCSESKNCVAECTVDLECASGKICKSVNQVNGGAICTTGCREDKECSPGEICGLGNSCVRGCRTDSSCSLGEICINKICTPGCRSAANCGNNMACKNRMCYFSCAKDDDCLTTEKCSSGVCILAEQTLPAETGMPIENQIIETFKIVGKVTSEVDDSIVAGAEVSLEENSSISTTTNSTGGFILDVNPGEYTVNVYKEGFSNLTRYVSILTEDVALDVKIQPGTPSETIVSCVTNLECTPGQTCVSGSCVNKPGCNSDTDCASGEECKAGVCETIVTPITEECTSDIDCPSGDICDGGKCTTPEIGGDVITPPGEETTQPGGGSPLGIIIGIVIILLIGTGGFAFYMFKTKKNFKEAANSLLDMVKGLFKKKSKQQSFNDYLQSRESSFKMETKRIEKPLEMPKLETPKKEKPKKEEEDELEKSLREAEKLLHGE